MSLGRDKGKHERQRKRKREARGVMEREMESRVCLWGRMEGRETEDGNNSSIISAAFFIFVSLFFFFRWHTDRRLIQVSC